MFNPMGSHITWINNRKQGDAITERLDNYIATVRVEESLCWSKGQGVGSVWLGSLSGDGNFV